MRALLIAAILMTSPTGIEAYGGTCLCYILDVVLIIWGVVITVFLFRLRMSRPNKTPDKQSEKPPIEDAIYTGLTPHDVDIYQTISTDKRSVV